MMARLGQIIFYMALTLCAKHVTSLRYSTAGAGGRMNALRSYKLADSK
jgi:hypothetical protein